MVVGRDVVVTRLVVVVTTGRRVVLVVMTVRCVVVLTGLERKQAKSRTETKFVNQKLVNFSIFELIGRLNI